ncbi:MAG: hypothetical protein K9M99_05190 [Candidatus Cloacimonetes bacterium]|nr:hypothetical protein [Candidatus Cloacimonadota bacterium]
MGSSIQIKCSNCNYSETFMLGIGMMYNPIRVLDFDPKHGMLPQMVRSKKTIEQIRTLIEDKHAELDRDYGHKIYHCNSCKMLFERFYIKLVYEGGIFEIDYKCPTCKSILEPVNRSAQNDSDELPDLKNYNCPECGKHSLYKDEYEVICWD